MLNDSYKTPETTSFYNETKCGVDIIDQIARQYSVKSDLRICTFHMFCNIVELASTITWVYLKL